MMHASTASIESSSCRVLIGPLSPIIIFSLSCEPAGRVSGPHDVPGGVVGLMGIELEVTFRVPQRIYLFIYCFLFYFSISFAGSLRCVRAAFFLLRHFAKMRKIKFKGLFCSNIPIFLESFAKFLPIFLEFLCHI